VIASGVSNRNSGHRPIWFVAPTLSGYEIEDFRIPEKYDRNGLRTTQGLSILRGRATVMLRLWCLSSRLAGYGDNR
jgi:hypothetical protein